VTILAFHSCNNSTLFLPLEEVTSRGLAPCAATILIIYGLPYMYISLAVDRLAAKESVWARRE
jgi:hypothetical protein